jgi:hypothetical protein
MPLLIIQTTGFVQGVDHARFDMSANCCGEPLTVLGLPEDFWDQRLRCLRSEGALPDLVFTCRDLVVAIPGDA